MLVIASDGELYGHHQTFRDLFLHRLVAPSETTQDRGYDVVTLAAVAEEAAGHPHPEIRIRDRTSWSCHHGVLRWSGECPDAADGRWKAPLRAATGATGRRHRRDHRGAGPRAARVDLTSGLPATATWTS